MGQLTSVLTLLLQISSPLGFGLWKLRRLSGQLAEAKVQAFDACFEGVRDIGKLF